MNSIYLDNKKGSSNGRPNNNVVGCTSALLHIFIKKKKPFERGNTI